MQTIKRENSSCYLINGNITPALKVSQNEKFKLETEDAASGYLRDEKTLPISENRPTHKYSPPLLNPVAGPVYIEGAEKGDTVVVEIEKIVPDSQGYTILQPGEGLLGDSVKHIFAGEYLTKILNHVPGKSGTLKDGSCFLNKKISWPMNPFIGTLCLSPEREIPTSVFIQGPYGGNLDCRDFCAGAKIYFNSYVKGGMLYAGDVHGSQGDGELTGTANEIRAELTLSCSVIKEQTIPHVRVERPDSLIALCCDKPAEFAIKGAVENAIDWLDRDYGMDKRDAYLLIGTCSGVRINVYQMVSIPQLSYTVGIEIPKSVIG